MARKQFLLRIDPELWNDLEKWAADDLRSVNAQIEWLLREAVRKRRGTRARQDPLHEDAPPTGSPRRTDKAVPSGTKS